METPRATLQPLRNPGIASAEDGVVILDGPEGVAVTMTPDAAEGTGHSLIAAAQVARAQTSDEGELGAD
jgi:hypothetical protein